MAAFPTRMLPAACDVLAPDGSEVRMLLSATGGSMAHFRLEAGQVSRAMRHRSVDEIWYVLSGAGEMWRSSDRGAETVVLTAGLCLVISAGVRFQFRASDAGRLEVVAVTMPPWPGVEEAVPVEGPWVASL